jgi:hypothetical protein
MQRRIVDRVGPKTLFPFGARAKVPVLKYMGNRVGLILGAVQSRTAPFSCVLPSWVAKW